MVFVCLVVLFVDSNRFSVSFASVVRFFIKFFEMSICIVFSVVVIMFVDLLFIVVCSGGSMIFICVFRSAFSRSFVVVVVVVDVFVFNDLNVLFCVIVCIVLIVLMIVVCFFVLYVCWMCLSVFLMMFIVLDGIF